MTNIFEEIDELRRLPQTAGAGRRHVVGVGRGWVEVHVGEEQVMSPTGG